MNYQKGSQFSYFAEATMLVVTFLVAFGLSKVMIPISLDYSIHVVTGTVAAMLFGIGYLLAWIRRTMYPASGTPIGQGDVYSFSTPPLREIYVVSRARVEFTPTYRTKAGDKLMAKRYDWVRPREVEVPADGHPAAIELSESGFYQVWYVSRDNQIREIMIVGF
jgi:hypothetical protein